MTELIDEKANLNVRLTWNLLSSTSTTMVSNRGYITDSTSITTLTLPTIAAIGDVFGIINKNSGGFKIAQNNSQTIHFGNQSTTTGTSGYLQSNHRRDVVYLMCIAADSDFVVYDSVGNITVN